MNIYHTICKGAEGFKDEGELVDGAYEVEDAIDNAETSDRHSLVDAKTD